MDYKIEYTDKEITPWAGILMLRKCLIEWSLTAALTHWLFQRKAPIVAFIPSTDQTIYDQRLVGAYFFNSG